MARKPNARPPDLKAIYNGIALQVQKGADAEKLIEKLPLEVYDAMIDAGFNFDRFTLTEEQLKGINETKRAPRPKGLTYNKKYPKDKQDFYKAILNFVEKYGGKIQPKERENYGEITFLLNDRKFKIVISNPRN